MNRIAEIFGSAVGEINYEKHYVNSSSEAAVLTGTKYFLRTNDTIGFCLFSYYDGSHTRIDFGRIGGGSGLLNLRMGAGNKIETSIMDGIRQYAESSGMSLSESDGKVS